MLVIKELGTVLSAYKEGEQYVVEFTHSHQPGAQDTKELAKYRGLTGEALSAVLESKECTSVNCRFEITEHELSYQGLPECALHMRYFLKDHVKDFEQKLPLFTPFNRIFEQDSNF